MVWCSMVWYSTASGPDNVLPSVFDLFPFLCLFVSLAAFSGLFCLRWSFHIFGDTSYWHLSLCIGRSSFRRLQII